MGEMDALWTPIPSTKTKNKNKNKKNLGPLGCMWKLLIGHMCEISILSPFLTWAKYPPIYFVNLIDLILATPH